MKQIMNKLQEIANTYPEISIIDAHEVYSKASQKKYGEYIRKNKVRLNSTMQDEYIDSEAIKLTERYFKIDNIRRLLFK